MGFSQGKVGEMGEGYVHCWDKRRAQDFPSPHQGERGQALTGWLKNHNTHGSTQHHTQHHYNDVPRYHRRCCTTVALGTTEGQRSVLDISHRFPPSLHTLLLSPHNSSPTYPTPRASQSASVQK